MAICINDSGTWREASSVCVNDSGTWRDTSTGCINDSGTWREWGMGPDIGAAAIGDAIEGGILICKSGGIAYIVEAHSGYPARTRRNWYSRGDAITVAQAATGCSGWYIPSGSAMNSASPLGGCWFYDRVPYEAIWSDTQINSGTAQYNMWWDIASGGNSWFQNAQNSTLMTHTSYVRAWRNVAY